MSITGEMKFFESVKWKDKARNTELRKYLRMYGEEDEMLWSYEKNRKRKIT